MNGIKHYDRLVKAGELEEAEMYLPSTGRNTNPADLELRDFEETENKSFAMNWEEESEGECWNELEPVLQEIGEYAFEKLQNMNIADNFELAVNGSNDWYEFVWNKESK
jgi:hypothetical protein